MCEWTTDSDPIISGYVWKTQCGRAIPFSLSVNPVDDYGYKFCPFCGREIRIEEGEER